MPETRTHDQSQTLLFGVLAVQMDCIDREVLAESLEQWSLNPEQPISSILRQRHAASEDVLQRIDALVQEHIERHDGDPSQTLAQLPGAEGLTAELGRHLKGAPDELETYFPMTAPGVTMPFGSAPVELPPGESESQNQSLDEVKREWQRQKESQSVPENASGDDDDDLAVTEADPYATVVEGAFNPPPTLGQTAMPDGGRQPKAAFTGSASPAGPGYGSGSGAKSDPLGTVPFGQSPSNFDPLATSVDEVAYPNYGPGSAPGSGSGPSGSEHDPLATFELLRPLSGSGEAPRPAPSGFQTGSSRFRVLRPHAKGGLGAVLVAFDEELRREVALKEIQGRHADDPNSRARFLLEAEVTGGLEHPGVVPVYSLGAGPDGRPYYAMRFIRGQSLREAIKQFYDPDAGPQDPGERSIQFRQLLRRFIDTCNAIEYAHSRHVIHRDLKPDNIMLGPYGETLVVDWGLAKPLGHAEIPSSTMEPPLRPSNFDGSAPTLDGSAIGTPAFMAPEQAVGDLAKMGPASDIYSLGATLYQILTSKPAFTDKNVFTTLIKVKEGEFPKPREIRPDVPPALEAICLKAMALDTTDRYPSCRALADDLDHWLADEPVSIYREPWTARLARWARRHKTAVTGIAALMLTAIVALSVGNVLIGQEQARTLDQKIRADEQAALAIANEAEAVKNEKLAKQNEAEAIKNAEEADRQRDLATTQRNLALKYFQTSMDAVDELLTQVAEIDLADAPQMELVRKAMLERALGFFTIFLADYDTDLVRREAGVAHSRTGDIKEMLGELNEARVEYENALKIQEGLVEADPDSEQYRADLARTQNNLGILLKKLNAFQDSEDAFKKALGLRENLLEANPQEPDSRRALAESKYHLGALLARLRGRTEAAQELYQEAIKIERELVAKDPESAEDRRALARYLNNLGILLGGSNQASARQSFDEAIVLQRDLLEASRDTPHYRRELARSINNLAKYTGTEATEIPEEAYREAIEIARSLTEDFPKVPDYWQELAGYLSNLGVLLARTGQGKAAEELFQEAEQAYRKALEIRERLVEDHPARPEYKQRLAFVLNNLGGFLRGAQKNAEARPLIERAVALLEALVEEFDEFSEYKMDLASVLNEQAALLHSLEKSREADENQEAGDEGPQANPKAVEETYRRAIALGEQARTDREADFEFLSPLFIACKDLSALKREQEEFEEAAQLRDESLLYADRAIDYATAAADFMKIAYALLDANGQIRDGFEDLHARVLDRALELLQEAADLGYTNANALRSPGFAPLQDRQEFQDLIDRMEQEQAQSTDR